MHKPSRVVSSSKLESVRQDWRNELGRTTEVAAEKQNKPVSPRNLRLSQREDSMGRYSVLADARRTLVDSDPTRVSSFSDVFSFERNNSSQGGPLPTEDTNLAVEDEEMVESVQQTHPRRIVVGIDYGTTNTSISHSEHPINADQIEILPWEIKSIANWPDSASLGHQMQVPTESWYSLVAPPIRYPVTRGQNKSPTSGNVAMHEDSTDDMHDTSDEYEDEDEEELEDGQEKRQSAIQSLMVGDCVFFW